MRNEQQQVTEIIHTGLGGRQTERNPRSTTLYRGHLGSVTISWSITSGYWHLSDMAPLKISHITFVKSTEQQLNKWWSSDQKWSLFEPLSRAAAFEAASRPSAMELVSDHFRRRHRRRREANIPFLFFQQLKQDVIHIPYNSPTECIILWFLHMFVDIYNHHHSQL